MMPVTIQTSGSKRRRRRTTILSEQQQQHRQTPLPTRVPLATMVLSLLVLSLVVSTTSAWAPISCTRLYHKIPLRSKSALSASPISSSSPSPPSPPPPSSMQSALAILPPEHAWDNLQRARHLARDKSYTRWPPCIRLFHPFVAAPGDVALDLAAIIEKYQIEPFEIRLDQWMVIPHTEAMEADWHAMQQMETAAEQDSDALLNNNNNNNNNKRSEIDELIAREEALGRKNRRNREIRAQHKKEVEQQRTEEFNRNNNVTVVPVVVDDRSTRNVPTQPLDNNNNNNNNAAAAATATNVDGTKPKRRPRQPAENESHRELLEKQRRMYEEFNGPCVVCLEPDEESKEKLSQLRELLRQELFSDYDKYSPSSTVSELQGTSLPKAVLDSDELVEYRPLVAIGSYPTVSSAIEMARKLRSIWEPLTFDVRDLQLISCIPDEVQGESVASSSSNTNFDPAADLFPVNVHKTSWVSHGAGDEERSLQDDEQFGCDALVMLMGEELDMDQDVSQEMVNFVCEKGEAGGGSMEPERPPSQQDWVVELEEENGDMRDLAQWLDEEEDFDEGASVVIGRTHFFTGEMRKYVGMPATSVMDAKDRSMGADGISGAARRRGAVHRKGKLWEEGEWGRKDTDLKPRTRK